MYRNLVLLRNAFKYFSENKSWILSSLFVFSIIKDCVWYACFGISILTYSSIQDTFISLFHYLIDFVIIFITYIFVAIAPSNLKSKAKRNLIFISKSLIFILLSGIYFVLFKQIMSLITLYCILFFIYFFYSEKKYLQLLNILIICFVCLTIFEPLFQYNQILNNQQDIEDEVTFKLNENNMEFFSFIYENKKYDTKSKRYFLIGNTSNYFFLFDNVQDKSLIFPKNDCKNIKTEIFIMWDFNKNKLIENIVNVKYIR